MKSAPIIYKSAAPLMPLIQGIGRKSLPWLKKLLLKAPAAARGPVGFLAKPHYAMPAAGAGVGAISSFNSQAKDIQSGKQEKFNWGRLGKNVAIGAGAGLGASYIKPINNLWTKGFRTRGTTPGRTMFSKAETDAFLKSHPTWARQRFNRSKLFSKQYFKDIAQDLRHPIKSFKAIGTDITHGSKVLKDGTKIVYKRSPVGLAGSAAMNIGMPLSFVPPIAKDKDMSPAERAIRLGTLGASYATPKFLPSAAMWMSPDLFFRKKKPPVTAGY